MSEKEVDQGLLFRPCTEKLSMLHKPRGSKGVWQLVENKTKLRVTKGKGKRLKLQYNVQTCDEQDVQVILLDLEKRAVCKNGFSIESAKKINQSIEMDIKLLKVCKSSLQFCLHFTTSKGHSWVAKSVEFTTHNSGTVSTKSSPTPEKQEVVYPNGFSAPGVVLSSNRLPSSSERPNLTSISLKRSRPAVEDSSSGSQQPLITSPSMFIGSNNVITTSPSHRVSPLSISNLVSEKDSVGPLHCDCGCMPSQSDKSNPEAGFNTQRFQCLTCSEEYVICIICAISCHAHHKIKYAGLSSQPCSCFETRKVCNQTDLCTLPPILSPDTPDDLPANKHLKTTDLETLGFVAQICAQSNPLPVV